MSLCGSCRSIPTAIQPAVLCQIREGYRAQWRDLTLNVESDSSQWTLRVQDSAGAATLYTAHRSGQLAARLAAAEFAAFRAQVNPDQLAGQLTWKHYW
jgi:hypothetical protein